MILEELPDAPLESVQVVLLIRTPPSGGFLGDVPPGGDSELSGGCNISSLVWEHLVIPQEGGLGFSPGPITLATLRVRGGADKEFRNVLEVLWFLVLISFLCRRNFKCSKKLIKKNKFILRVVASGSRLEPLS